MINPSNILKIAEELLLAGNTTYDPYFLPEDFWDMFRGGCFGTIQEGLQHRVLALCLYVAMLESKKDWKKL